MSKNIEQQYIDHQIMIVEQLRILSELLSVQSRRLDYLEQENYQRSNDELRRKKYGDYTGK